MGITSTKGAKMSDFHVTITLLLSIVILFAMTLQEDSASWSMGGDQANGECNYDEDCPAGFECTNGVCLGHGSTLYTPAPFTYHDECRSNADCSPPYECIYMPGEPLPGFCDHVNKYPDRDVCRTDVDCPGDDECLLDLECRKSTGQCDYKWYCYNCTKYGNC